MDVTPRLQIENTILATRDWLISQNDINVPFELKRRDPKEPGRRRKEKAEDKTYKVTMRHFRKQKKALRDNLEWHYPQRMKVVGTTDYTDLLSDDDYDAQLQAMLTQAAQDGVLLFEETGVGMPSIDYTLVNTQAAKWASKYSGKLIKGIDATTLASVRGAVSAFVDTPGMTIGDVMRGLGPTFSEDRALMIATTEITKAYAEADKLAGDQMAKEFPDMEVVKTWWTNNDDLVCQICGPNHNVTVLKGENFPSGNDSPPAHPRCRCWRSTTTRMAEEVVEPRYTGAEARAEIKRLDKANFAERVRLTNQIERLQKDRLELLKLYKQREQEMIAAIKAGDDNAAAVAEALQNAVYEDADRLADEIMALRKKNMKLMDGLRAEIFEKVLYVDDPLSLEYYLSENFHANASEGLVLSNEIGMTDFQRMVSKRLVAEGRDVTFFFTDKGRAFYSEALREVHLTRYSNGKTTIHELGHWLEHGNDDIIDAIEDFYTNRTKGESLQKLSDVESWGGYKDHEVTRPDKFISSYMGKDYGRRGSSEILSMGLEYMYDDALTFATKDPEMFDFIYDLVRGVH